MDLFMCHLFRHFLFSACLALTLTAPVTAEIIGLEQFDYPDGAIVGQVGGTFWDYKNTLHPPRTPAWLLAGMMSMGARQLALGGSSPIAAH